MASFRDVSFKLKFVNAVKSRKIHPTAAVITTALSDCSSGPLAYVGQKFPRTICVAKNSQTRGPERQSENLFLVGKREKASAAQKNS